MDQLAIGGADALAVVVATAAIYLVCLGLLRVLGQGTLTSMSLGDLACLLAVGAVVGRTALLAVPSLGGGVVALATLFAMQRLIRLLSRRRWVHALLNRPPVVLVRDGCLKADALRRTGVTADDLRQRLRLTGIGRWEQAGRVVLERTGEISVVRRAPGLDEDLFSDTASEQELERASKHC